MLPQHEPIYRTFFDTLLFHNPLSKLRAMELSALDITSFAWFVVCWTGYTLFSRRAAKKRNSLSSVLYRYRMEWVKKLSQSGMSEVDTELLASLEKQVSFLASTSLLILASLVTVLGTASNRLMDLSSLSFVSAVSLEVIQMKLMVLIFVFIYAFFTFTWSIRQWRTATTMAFAPITSPWQSWPGSSIPGSFSAPARLWSGCYIDGNFARVH